MIGPPRNDMDCLGPVTNTIIRMVADRDPYLITLATKFPTRRHHVDHIRSLPQRDDLGDPDDGPRVHECTPSQRIHLDGHEPNCFERSAAFVAVEELREPRDLYQLTTIDTPMGMHTMPLVNGKAVILNPRLTRNCVDCGLALGEPGPVAVEPRNAIAWTSDMAESEAAGYRNGTSTLYRARNAIRSLIDKGTVPSTTDVDAIGVLFALAERVAKRYSVRALALVRTTARAIAEILDTVLAQRNLSFDIGGYHLNTPKWLDDGATAVGKVGLDLGSLYLRAKLGALGVAPELVGLVESRLGEEGLTLGPLAHPPELATFKQFAAPRRA